MKVKRNVIVIFVTCFSLLVVLSLFKPPMEQWVNSFYELLESYPGPVFSFIERLAPWAVGLLVILILSASVKEYLKERKQWKKEQETPPEPTPDNPPPRTGRKLGEEPFRYASRVYGTRLVLGLAIIISVKTGFEIAHILKDLENFEPVAVIRTIIMSILALALVIINRGLETALEKDMDVDDGAKVIFIFISLFFLALLTAFLCWLYWVMKQTT